MSNLNAGTTTSSGAGHPLTLAVVSGGMSDASSTALLADRLTEAALDGLGPVPTRVVRVDLRPLAHDIADHLLTGFPGAALRTALEQVAGADALIAATPTFKASYSGLFKSFFDLFDENALEDIPVLLAATGGTARHSLMLDSTMRPLFAYLKAFTLPSGVFAATDDWAGGSLEARIRRSGAQLSRAMAPAVSTAPLGGVPAGAGRRTPKDDFSGIPDFADLLARAGQ